jgi:hypothetical protein
MRKPLFAAAVFMISTMAHAGPSLRVAQNDQPAAAPVVITTEPAEPAQAVQSKPAEPAAAVQSTTASEPAKATESTKASETESDKAAAKLAKASPELSKTADPAPVAEGKPVQTPKAKPHVARQESAEQKARRIAAKYGVYW